MIKDREAKVLRRICGWQVGDKCAVQGKTKKLYGTIIFIKNAYPVKALSATEFFQAIASGKNPPKPKGRLLKSYQYAVVQFESKSPIPYRQNIPLDELLEDDR